MPHTEAPDTEAPDMHRDPPPGWKRWRRGLLVFLGMTAALALITWYVVIPYPWALGKENPQRTALQEQRVAEARADARPFEIRQAWVPLEDISPNLVRAVIVAEDYRFRQHGGVDWVSLAEEVDWQGDDDFSWLSPSDLDALAEAVHYAWENKDELKGRSTITQQLAKNLYFGTDRSFARKGLELVVARRLERRLGKDRILELYLNTAEWGPGVFGAEAAAQEYFGRSASRLTLEQAATLAATLPHPLTSNAKLRPSRMLWRRDLLLDRLSPDRHVPLTPAPIRDLTVDLGGVDVDPELLELRALEPLSDSVSLDAALSAAPDVELPPGSDPTPGVAPTPGALF